MSITSSFRERDLRSSRVAAERYKSDGHRCLRRNNAVVKTPCRYVICFICYVCGKAKMRASHLARQSYWDPRRRFRGKERFFLSFLPLFFVYPPESLSFYSSFRSFLAFSSSLVRDGILHRRDAAFIPTLSRLAGHIPVCVKEISD